MTLTLRGPVEYVILACQRQCSQNVKIVDLGFTSCFMLKLGCRGKFSDRKVLTRSLILEFVLVTRNQESCLVFRSHLHTHEITTVRAPLRCQGSIGEAQNS